ncbi:MAG: hypothetical protein F6K35_03755 [Okeania sp. SIO2H7]|nr:hypothetical protein [Okeania sp. SIO2H7]
MTYQTAEMTVGAQKTHCTWCRTISARRVIITPNLPPTLCEKAHFLPVPSIVAKLGLVLVPRIRIVILQTWRIRHCLKHPPEKPTDGATNMGSYVPLEIAYATVTIHALSPTDDGEKQPE